jgi:large subunit ribosomal protein L19
MNILDIIENENIRKDELAPFNIGDTVKVFVKIKEGEKERLQAYEGTVMSKRNGSVRETFTVRRVSYGIGVERTYPYNSPLIDHVEVTRKGSARRSKLYYLRDLTGKRAKTKAAKE